jgi:hypothetical protein
VSVEQCFYDRKIETKTNGDGASEEMEVHTFKGVKKNLEERNLGRWSEFQQKQ